MQRNGGVSREEPNNEQANRQEEMAAGNTPVTLQFFPAHMQASYVRTRHKNVRCFPNCAGIHNERSFCGDSLLVTVTGEHSGNDTHIIGEFRPLLLDGRPSSSLRIGDELSTDALLRYLTATLVTHQGGTESRFSFNPPRKWECKAKCKPDEKHVFTAYCIQGNAVIGTADTEAFVLVPIWKNPKPLAADAAEAEEDEDEVVVDETNSVVVGPRAVLPFLPSLSPPPPMPFPFHPAPASMGFFGAPPPPSPFLAAGTGHPPFVTKNPFLGTMPLIGQLPTNPAPGRMMQTSPYQMHFSPLLPHMTPVSMMPPVRMPDGYQHLRPFTFVNTMDHVGVRKKSRAAPTSSPSPTSPRRAANGGSSNLN